MISRLTLYCLLCLFFPSVSFALFCPTNFSQINIGDSIAQVQQTCGKPDKEETSTEKPATPQEWSYFIPQTVSTGGMNTTQGTLKTQIAFDANGKVISISVNGVGVGSTTMCNNKTIQLGSDKEDIKGACGQPAFITNGQPSGTEQETKIVTDFYNSTPPVKLIFENGILKEKQ